MSTTSPAVTLPARAYTDPVIFERERHELFARSWTPVCSTAQVAAPGDYVSTSIAGEPVIVLRGEDGELRALSNVCRHRASLLVREAGSCPRVLRCPYHGWTYGHDGQLVGVPEARGFDDLDRDAVKLPQFAIGVLAGLVCVNLDPDAEPLAGWFGELEQRLEAFGLGGADRPGPVHRRVRAQLEGDRRQLPRGLPHPGRPPRPAAPARLQALHADPRPAALVDRRADARRNAFQGQARAAVPARLRADARVPAGARQLVDVRAHVPLDVPRHLPRPDRHLAAAAARAATDAHDLVGVRARRRLAARQAARKANWTINQKVMDEDVELCDGVQEGLESLTYQRGVLNRNEAAVLHFHNMLREAIPGIDEP